MTTSQRDNAALSNAASVDFSVDSGRAYGSARPVSCRMHMLKMGA
jgi:hypothetical protein